MHKFQKLASAFSSTFTGGTGVLEYPSPTPNIEMEQPTLPNEKKSVEVSENAQKQLEQKNLKEIQQKVNTYITDKSLENKLKTTLTDEGLLITILDDIFFDSGSADVRNKDKNLAKEISELLVMNPPVILQLVVIQTTFRSVTQNMILTGI